MKRIPQLILLVLFVFVICGAAQTPPPPPPRIPDPSVVLTPAKEWREFKHEAGNFAVIMPGEPAAMSQSIDTEIGKVPVKFFTAQDGLVSYMAMYVEYPLVFDTPGAVKNALDNGRDLMLSKMGATLISEKKIAYGKYAGREWKAAGNKFVMRSRTYFVNQRLYHLMVMMPEDEDKRLSEAKSNDVVKFFDSFKLIKEPDPPPASAGSMAQLESKAEKIVPPEDFFNRPTAWREFSSKEHGFNIQFPSEPFHQAIPLVPDNRKLDIQLWMATGDDVVCQMLVQPMLTQPRDETQRNILFKGLVAGIADDGDMKLLSEEPISFRGHPGRKYKFQMATGAVSGKAYIIGARVYLLLTIIVGAKGGEKEMARFFDSFTPLDAPASPSEPAPIPPPAPLPVSKDAINVSGGLLQGSATKKVEPVYPPIAKAAKVEGAVSIQVTISEEGKMIEAVVIEGHPLLRAAALQAARQWEFEPTKLSGIPVKVVGVLTFTFTLK